MAISIAVVGLGFGQDFVPIYLSHPNVERVVLVDRDADLRAKVAADFGIAESYADLEAVLTDPSIDAVHLLTPVATHADFTVAALEAGKHVACAVPMATSLEDLDRIIRAEESSGCRYMMMETAVYGREYRLVAPLVQSGQFRPLTLYRGFHIQNLDGFPSYWQGFPPMQYATHAISPILSMLDTEVVDVRCLGAGRLTESRRAGGFGNAFPSEVGLFRLHDTDAIAEVTMAFAQTAHPYAEGFSLFGEHRGFTWPGDDDQPGVLYRMESPAEGDRGNPVFTETISHSSTPTLSPELAPFTEIVDFQREEMLQPVRVHPSHGGSHPFLVQEFIASIVAGSASPIHARRAASWTAPGIIAHLSALMGGETLSVPHFLRS